MANGQLIAVVMKISMAVSVMKYQQYSGVSLAES